MPGQAIRRTARTFILMQLYSGKLKNKTQQCSAVYCSCTTMHSRCYLILQPQSLPAQLCKKVLPQTDGAGIVMTIHTQPVQAGWCFQKHRLFYLSRTVSKDRRESRRTCCRSGTYTASNALSGCFLHWPSQKVFPLWMNLLTALHSYSSARNTALSSHAPGAMVEKCLWDHASTHRLGRRIQPKVFVTLLHSTDTSVSIRSYWKDSVACVNAHEISYMCVFDGNIFIYYSGYGMRRWFP